MIEPLEGRLECPLDVRKIQQPTGFGVDPALADQFDVKAVPVKATALVPGRGVGQTVRSLKRKAADQSH